MRSFILSILLLSIPCILPSDQELKVENEFIVLPFAYYTTDTSFAFGIFAQYKFDEEDMIFGNTVYTLKNQFMFLGITDKKFANLFLHNTLKVKDYFSESFGTGNTTSLDDKIKYRYFQVDNMIEAGTKICRNSIISAAVNNFVHKPEQSGKYKDEMSVDYSNEDTQVTNGIGVSFKFSNVTRKFFRDGYFFRSRYLFYPSEFGNIDGFSVIETKGAYFRSIRESAINILLSSKFTTGSTHPEKLSYIGGSSVMRGYPEKRFLDRNMISIQTQYDIRVYKKISACLFVSAGDVFDKFDDLSIKKTKIGYGTGILYDFKGLNMRFDIATSSEKEIQIIIIGLRAF
ncbi:MAG: hypothetical protein R6V47_06610 [Candidatus Delongbacteria bacterium]